MRRVLKFLMRKLILIDLLVVLVIFAIVIAYGEFQQLMDLELWEKVTLFVTTILPYLLYTIYTKTKYYQFPQLSFQSRKTARDAIEMDTLESLPSTSNVQIGRSWLKIVRKDLGTQVKYIKLDMLKGICFISTRDEHMTRVESQFQFVDVTGKIITIEGCRYFIPREELEELERKIMEGGNVEQVRLCDLKKFALQCKNAAR